MRFSKCLSPIPSKKLITQYLHKAACYKYKRMHNILKKPDDHVLVKLHVVSMVRFVTSLLKNLSHGTCAEPLVVSMNECADICKTVGAEILSYMEDARKNSADSRVEAWLFRRNDDSSQRMKTERVLVKS